MARARVRLDGILVHRSLRYMFAATIVVLLAYHASSWSPSQLLWACHLASIAIAVGLVCDVPWLIAVGIVFHLGEGIPAYVLDLAVTGETTVTSVLLHVIPLGAGVWALWGRPLPRRILVPAWLLHPCATVAAYVLADPALNVMLSRHSYGTMFSALWMSWIANAVLSFICLTIGWLLLRSVWRRWD